MFSFGEFLVLGNCSICGTLGVGGQVTGGQVISVASTQIGDVTITGGNPGQGLRLFASSGPSPIAYGDTGVTGTVIFDSTFTISNNSNPSFQVANVNFQVFDNPPGTVPGPVPLLGAAAAFGYSRKLRRRVAEARTTSEAQS